MNELQVQESNKNQLALDSFDSMMQFATTAAKSGLCPAGLDTAEKVFVAVEMGKELNLPPMVAVNNIAVINGKPSLSTDIMNAIVKNNPSYCGTKWIQQDDKKAECLVTRELSNGKGTEQYRGSYSIEDAQKAGLLNKDNWKKYPARMLQHRALAYALRDAFPDLLSGLYTPEEMESIQEEKIINITPPEVRDEFDEEQKKIKKIAKQVVNEKEEEF